MKLSTIGLALALTCAVTSQASAQSGILYAPAGPDNGQLRGELSAAMQGTTVDYFDARAGTPDAVLLSGYAGVLTWPAEAYADKVLFGDNLATYCDMGGNVVLSTFCTLTSAPNHLAGAIMGANYSPVYSPSGFEHGTQDFYQFDGASCIYDNTKSFISNDRDILAIQGNGIVDGTYGDGEIVHAYRPIPASGGGAVVYSNGGGPSATAGLGSWIDSFANIFSCIPGAGVGNCTSRAGQMGLNPSGYNCVNAPIAGGTWHTQVDFTPTVGTSTTLSTLMVLSLSGGVDNVPFLGYEMLCLPPYILLPNLGMGDHFLPVPPLSSGLNFSTQGARIEQDLFGNIKIVLLNAQDVVIG